MVVISEKIVLWRGIILYTPNTTSGCIQYGERIRQSNKSEATEKRNASENACAGKCVQSYYDKTFDFGIL